MSIFGNNELFAEFNSVNEEAWIDDDSEDVEFYKEENEKLKTENEELRKALRIITQPTSLKLRDPSRDGPVAQVLLFNNSIARKEKSAIEQFFRGLTSRRNQDNDYTLNPQLSSLRCPASKVVHTKAKNRHGRKLNKAFTVTDSLQFYSEGFCCDHIGEPLLSNDTIRGSFTEYERAHLDPLDGEIEEENDENSRFKIKRCCFNCGMKDHQLKDCPTPKDFASINRRKQAFLGQMNNSPQAGSNRYHADRETDSNDPRFLHFKPGVLSEALREALGIGMYELPPYIYQMRLIGYPPGHLEEAKITGSGLSFYSGRNKKSKSDHPDLEGAPVDVDKILDYPGFNVDPGRHVIDNHEELGMLPMDQQHSKDVMVSYHKHRNELLKRKAEIDHRDEHSHKRPKPSQEVVAKKDDVREVDMDTGDDGCPDDESAVGLKDEETKEVEESKPSLDAEGVVVVATEDEEVVYESPEEGECIDDVEAGNLDEEQLQIRRDIILRELQQEDLNDDVIYVPNEEPPIVDLTSDVEVINEEVSLDSSALHSNEENINDEQQIVEQIIESEEDAEASIHKEDSRNKLSTSSLDPNQSLKNNDKSNGVDGAKELGNGDQSHCFSERESPESPLMVESCVDSCEDVNVGSSETGTEEQRDTLSSIHSSILPSMESSSDGNIFELQEGETSEEPGVPHRSKFAEGITEFGSFQVETKSKGVYKKLRKLLKNSPRRATKES